MRNLFTYVAFALLVAVASPAAAQQVPEPGTSIDNQAQVWHFLPGLRDTVFVKSNTVSILVQKVNRLDIEPNHRTKTRKGQVASFKHQITNAGNATVDIIITAANVGGDDYDLNNIGFSAGQTQKAQAAGTTTAADDTALAITLQSGDTFNFTVSVQVPNTANAGDIGKINVQAKTTDGQLVVNNTDILQVLEGPVINVQKKAVESSVEQGNVLTYVITGQNEGDQNARALNITVDGATQNKVVLRDKIPVNTTFLRSEDTQGGQALYHTTGGDKYEYSSQPPSDLLQVDEFAVVYDSLPPGQQFEARFAVTVNQNAAGRIKNIARVDYNDPVDDGQHSSSAETNLVQDVLPEYDATLDYYTSDAYSTVRRATRLGDALRLQANAAGCNVNVSLADTTTIQLSSEKTTDLEEFKAIETGPNTGFFRVTPNVPTREASKVTVSKNNGIFETLANDVIKATLPKCGENQTAATARIRVSPYGVIFSSKTGEPVANARITLIDITGKGNGGNADVYDADGKNKVDNPQMTSANGQFEFPYVKPGAYRIEVTPPAGYRFASSVAIANLPANRSVDKDGSYGNEFTVANTPGPVAFDVPVDPATEGALFIEKKSSVSNAQIGDFISYQITVSNNAASAANDVKIRDTLPFGFRYEKGTARLNDKSTPDPDGGKGPLLVFNIGDMPANSTAKLNYRVLLGSGVRNGDATNTAVATSDADIHIESNEARNTIKVSGGVFTDKGYIIGKVFSDCNNNNVQDPGEWGVPGVRIYLENGNFVVTDSEGKYTFYGIIPNKHILKLDNYSLPKGSKLSTLDNRHAGDPSSRFVDLKKGEMQRADFATCNCTSAIHKRIEARRKAFSSLNGEEVGASLKHDLKAEDDNLAQRVKRTQASGVIGGADIPVYKQEGTDSLAAPGKMGERASTGKPAGADSPVTKIKPLEEVMVHEKAELGFIGMHDGDTLQTAQTRIRVKSKIGPSLSLKLNGEEIGGDQIGKRGNLPPTNLQAMEYIGINLKPGKNTLTLTETDSFGNKRGTKTITVYAPGKIEKIAVSVPKNNVPADGSSAAVVHVELQDKSGLPVHARIPITLDVSIGTWLEKDLNPSTPGLQTIISAGARDFKLQAPIKPQDAKVSVAIGANEEEATVSFLPDLRPLIAAGIIEGTIRFNDGATIVPARSADRFERELKSLSYSTGNATADGRIAFFLKGKIKGNLLLTAGFDSEKDDDELFRDIEPDKFYPVYGESSVKGYDAQSTSRLYVRVDHKKTYALYGDFRTQQNNPAKSLGEYNRTQTGIKLHYEKNWGRLNMFGSQANSLQRIEEFRGQGISGPYNLKSNNILVNSEQIEIITRDRNQPSIIIDRKKLTRFRDYVIEPFTGNLIFKAPVASVDEDLNPIFIRATYEVQDGGNTYLVGGADGEFKLTNFFEVGGSFVEDRNPENAYRLKSLNTTLQLGKNTTVMGEVAESTTDLDGTGRGERVQLQHKGHVVNGTMYAGRTDADFVNRSSQLGQGRTEAGARASVDLTHSTRLKGEFIYSSNDTLNKNTTGGQINIQQQFGDALQAEFGYRYSKQNQPQSLTAGEGDITNKDVRGKLTLEVPKVTGASVFGEYEQNISKSDRRLIALGGDYKIKNIAKVYARHEFISSSDGLYRLNSSDRNQNTVVGIDADYMKNGKVYSEYRAKDAFDGRDAQAAIGLKNRFQIREGFGVNTGFERIFSLSGDPADEGTAISTAVDYTANPLWKGTARAEVRFSHDRNTYFNTLGYGRKINPNWTFLGKNVFSLQTSFREGSINQIQQRLRFGFAYRQTHRNRWDALGRYEVRYEQNGQAGDEYHRLVHIFSSNVNYHPNAKWTHTARLAAKKVGESSAAFDSKSLTMLLSARSTYDITRKLDGGVNASLMSDAGFGSKDYGVGAEMGYIVHRNLRLAVGFNVFGFSDSDLAASKYTRKGVYVGFSYKFDERLFRGLMPDADKHTELYDTCKKCIVPIQPAKVLHMPAPEIEFSGLQPAKIEARPLDIATHKSLTTLPKDIHFASDQSSISKASRQMLDLVATFLNGQQAFKLEILGHTDSRASYSYNLGLSKRRAQAVEKYLISKGVTSNLVSFKGMSEGKGETTSEQDVIDRAMNRLVKLNFDIPNVNVRFIPQVNDLQVEKHLGNSIPGWDYIFNTQINAVPDCIHVKGESLSGTTKYVLNRMVLALKYYPDEKAIFKVRGPQKVSQKQVIASFLKQAGADMNQFEMQAGSGSAGSDGRVGIDYGSRTQLKVVHQRDDLQLANNAAVQPVLTKLLKLLKMRQDYLLITKKN